MRFEIAWRKRSTEIMGVHSFWAPNAYEAVIMWQRRYQYELVSITSQHEDYLHGTRRT